MLRKNYFIILTAIALLIVSSVAVFAQTAPVRGTVNLKKADGTTVPVANAVIDVYRTDAKGKLPSGKTDKKGIFAFAGLPFGQIFMFVVSAPGVQPQYFPNIKAGQDNIVFTVYEGDGKRLTEEEARQLLTAPKKSDNTAGTDDNTAKPSAEDEAAAKKAQAEYEKKVAEVNSRNEKINNINKVIDKALNDGKSALDAKNYDAAITAYGEGYNADPNFAGTAPVFLNNRGTSYRLRGFETYKKSNTDTANKASLLESAKTDFTGAINDFNKSLEILKKESPTDPKVQKDYESYKRMAVSGLVETYRLLIATRADTTKTKEAAAALAEYASTETDPAQKLKTQLLMADALRLAGDSASALPIYQQVLEADPNNIDALGGMGLSLFNEGVGSDNKEQMQEGLNMMKRFADTAPDTHPMKNDIKGAVDYLVNTVKLTPQKSSKPASSTKKKP